MRLTMQLELLLVFEIGCCEITFTQMPLVQLECMAGVILSFAAIHVSCHEVFSHHSTKLYWRKKCHSFVAVGIVTRAVHS